MDIKIYKQGYMTVVDDPSKSEVEYYLSKYCKFGFDGDDVCWINYLVNNVYIYKGSSSNMRDSKGTYIGGSDAVLDYLLTFIGSHDSESSRTFDWGLEFLEAQTDVVNATSQYTAGEDWYMEMKIRVPSPTMNKYFGANDPSHAGGFRATFAISSGAGTWLSSFYQVGNFTTDVVVQANTWYVLRMEYVWSTNIITTFVDGVEKGTYAPTVPQTHNIVFPIGRHNSEAYVIDNDIAYIDLNGDMFAFNEGIGGTVSGTVSGVKNITTDRDNVNNMWIST